MQQSTPFLMLCMREKDIPVLEEPLKDTHTVQQCHDVFVYPSLRLHVMTFIDIPSLP